MTVPHPESPRTSSRHRPERGRGSWLALGWGALAFALLAALVLWLQARREPAPAHGEPPRAALPGGDPSAVAAPLEPVGPIAAPPETFRWRRDPGARSYRLEVYDPAGVLLVGAVLRDTSAAAARLGADTLRAGAWRVVPIGGDGAERPARPAVSFTRIGG